MNKETKLMDLILEMNEYLNTDPSTTIGAGSGFHQDIKAFLLAEKELELINMKDDYIFKSGNLARVLCTDIDLELSVVVINQSGAVYRLDKYGKDIFGEAIITKKQKEPETRFYNAYIGGNVHNTRDEADECAAPNRIACIEFKVGEGLPDECKSTVPHISV